MNKRIIGSVLMAAVFAALLLGASMLLFGGDTQASAPPVGASAGAAQAAQSEQKAAPPAGVWATVAPFPTISIPPTPGTFPARIKRAGAAAYPPNGKLYVLGGRAGTDGDDTTLRNVFEYTPGEPGTWLQKAALLDDSPVGSRWTANMAVAVLTDTSGVRIYAIGGSNIDSVPTNRVRVYNPVADTVTLLTGDPWPASPARSPGAWAVYNNKLYIFGGFSALGAGAVYPETWVFDPLGAPGAKWTQLVSANLPTARGFMGGAILDGFIYAIGGDTWDPGPRTLIPSNLVHRMDPSQPSPTWTAMANLPTARGDMGAWAYDTGTNYEISGRIAVAGGVFPIPDNVGYLYNPGTNTWDSFPNMVHATRNYGVGQLNGYLYAFGGYDYSGGLPEGANFNQRYDATAPLGTSTPTSTGTLPTSTRTSTAINTPIASNTPVSTATSTRTATVDPCLLVNYVVASATATVVTGTTNIGNACDDCSTLVTFPFPVQLYSSFYNSGNVVSNGNLQFNTTNTAFTNVCLPAAAFGPTIFPYWDDLRTDANAGCAGYPGGACGVFTSISGTAPNRIFNIEWRAVYFATPANPINFVLRLYEGHPQARFDVIYGVGATNASSTVGVQNAATGGLVTQYACNGVGGAVNPGTLLTFTLPTGCVTVTPGPSLTRTSTVAATVTRTSTVPPTVTRTATSGPPTVTATATPCVVGTVNVSIGNFFFDPQTVTIPVGSTVLWTNMDGTHDTTSDTGVWSSGPLNQGQTFSFTFNTPGTYPYNCTIHPGQVGTIIVTGPCPTSTAQATVVPTNTTPPTVTRTVTLPAPSSTSQPPPTSTFPPQPTNTPVTCNIQFTDVPVGATFYAEIRCLACRDIIDGYACGGTNPETGTPEPCDANNWAYFRPNNRVIRGQIAKMVSNSSADFSAPGPQRYADVPTTNTFFAFINRLTNRGVMGGYPCGGAGEPCNAQNQPYFRPFNNATRGQIAQIVARGANVNDTVPAGTQSFTDVPINSTFYLPVERLRARGVMTGFPCGGVNPQTGQAEPCDGANRAYFRVNNYATRGQTAQIVSRTFFPGCITPSR